MNPTKKIASELLLIARLLLGTVKTVKLHDGTEVLARFTEGGFEAVSYPNRNKASFMVAKLREEQGIDCEVYKGLGRPFYVKVNQGGDIQPMNPVEY